MSSSSDDWFFWMKDKMPQYCAMFEAPSCEMVEAKVEKRHAQDEHLLHLALGFDGRHVALNALEQLVDGGGLNPRHG